ncbi:hypothetical protein CSC94_15705 [Zhengella mangrovi]|uniref:DUF6867 domain-containing protein n=1 Tax=Zhengella mangrovi TaxID=1982044 RepID=A0A2G1QKR7_9HYPH|nr:hypothetical protein [Zhengella mangrovi]PHP66051.1 hypothetical protein CSC94_15705 [Zhengella mangrovi]
MEHTPSLLWEVTFFEFFVVTCVLGGGAAWMTGRAVANTWKPMASFGLYILLLAAAVRFIHFSLFQGSLIAPWYYMVDLIVLAIIGYGGYRYTRAGQMAEQYRFTFDRSGPFAWRRR